MTSQSVLLRMAAVLVLLMVPTAFAWAWPIIPLTDNDYSDEQPRISGDNVAWRMYDGSDYEICYYDGGTHTITQLTDNAYDDYSPEISGQNVVWYASDGSDDEVFYYDGTSVMPLTTNDNDDQRPHVSGTNVVWQGYDGDNYEIFLYEHSLGKTTQLTDTSYLSSNACPRISGRNVVWYGSHHELDTEIFFYDGTENYTKALTADDRLDWYPKIDGRHVVFTGERPGTIYLEVYYWPGLGDPYPLTDTPGQESNAEISGDNMCWLGDDGHDDEVFFYDGSTGTIRQISDNAYDDWFPRISGRNVVWYCRDAGTLSDEIYYFNGAGTERLTSNSWTDAYPDVSGNNVVWHGWDGHDYEIFFTVVPEPSSLVLALVALVPFALVELRRRKNGSQAAHP